MNDFIYRIGSIVSLLQQGRAVKLTPTEHRKLFELVEDRMRVWLEIVLIAHEYRDYYLDGFPEAQEKHERLMELLKNDH